MEKTNLEKTLMEELNALLEVDAAEARNHNGSQRHC